MPALDFITIRGFKSIRSIEKFPIGAVNVIVGPNGSGKSNFLGAFALLHAHRDGRLADHVLAAGGADRMLHYGAKVTRGMFFELGYDDGRIIHAGDFSHAIPDILRSGDWEVHCESRDALERFVDIAYKWKHFHFHDTGSTSPLRGTARLHDNRELRSDGGNLPAFLYRLGAGADQSETGLSPDFHGGDARDAIRDAVRQIAPFFDDFILEPSPLNPETIRLEWKHVGTDRYFDASDLSDGTLRFMALATLFLQPPELRPSVILVDEPELGLHPAAITLLAALVRSASTSSQVILSTQSPTLLDHFDPHEVIVADRIGGETKLERLDADRLKEWLEDYSLGQLWEKNEFGGRPAPERAR